MSNNGIQPELERVLGDLDSKTSIAVNAAEGDIYAAVDLGSNSFHLVISRYQHGEFILLDKQREVIRLAGGLDENNLLNDKVAARALTCLSKFGQLLRSIPADQVRVVGTNSLRRLQRKATFLESAEQALGHSIEIIAGREEARLIYLGVSKWSAMGDESRLVIDIGGGSTEIIAGKGSTSLCRESLDIGCVVLSKEFFSDGQLTLERFNQAKLAAKLAIQPVVKQFRLHGWNQVIGCSGTMKSLASALKGDGLVGDVISKEGLQQLLKKAVEFGHIDKLDLPGLTNDRTPVFAGGLAILMALFELFDIQTMSVSDIALREGVLYDLVGRSSTEDIRNVTVSAMLTRWSVEPLHGEQVRETALNLFDQVVADWDLADHLFHLILGWSAQLHELGLLVSHDGYHKHGAYLVANADMAGFARRDQLLLSAVIEGHRRKFPLDQFEQLPSKLVTPAKRVAIILRLAVLLHRGRNTTLKDLQGVSIQVQGQQVKLQFNGDWLANNPLTKADLEQECARLKTIGVKLSYS